MSVIISGGKIGMICAFWRAVHVANMCQVYQNLLVFHLTVYLWEAF